MRVVIGWMNRVLGLANLGIACAMLAVPGVSWGQGEWDDEEVESLAQDIASEERLGNYVPRIRMIATLCEWTEEQYEAGRTLMESHV